MDKSVRSMAVKTLILLAVIAFGLVAFPYVFSIVGLIWASHWVKPNTDNKIPLLNAMMVESRQNSASKWSATKGVLKFIPIGTTKAKVLTILSQNNFEYQITNPSANSEAIIARLQHQGLPCARHYIIVIELKNDLTKDVKAEFENLCL